MTKKAYHLITIAGTATLLTLVSCTGKSSQDDSRSIAFTNLTQSATYTLEGSAADYGRDRDITVFDSVSLMLPVTIHDHDISSLRDTIMKIAFDTTGTDHKEIIADYFAKSMAQSGYRFKEIETDSADMSQADGYDIISGSILNLSSDLLVYCINDNSYIPGAAHGMSTRQYVNYRVDTGKMLSLSDIFTPSGLKALPSLIEKQAKAMTAVLGPTEINDLPSGGNFYISDYGDIVFVYQPYEVASYAQGFISVPFYPYELVDHMTAEAIGFFNLQDLND